MRAVVQRTKSASVTVENKLISSINKGFLVLLSVESGDTKDDADYIIEKLSGLRIFEDQNGKMNLSIVDIGGEAIIVSQFTLHGDARKGRRPSFIAAARPETAVPLYEEVLHRMNDIIPTYAGVFGADMQVELINDGPVTILLDSKRIF